MGSNVHRLPCGRSEHEDYGCIDCGEYKACKLWAVVRGEMRLPNEVGRGDLVYGNYGIIVSWDKPPTEPLNRKEPYHRFIALSGTGKEK